MALLVRDHSKERKSPFSVVCFIRWVISSVVHSFASHYLLLSLLLFVSLCFNPFSPRHPLFFHIGSCNGPRLAVCHSR